MPNAENLIRPSGNPVKQHPQAVYALECSYDGPIPKEALARAQAIDAAWEAENPNHDGIAARKVAQFKAELSGFIAEVRAKGPNHVLTQRECRMLADIVGLLRHYRRLLDASVVRSAG